MPVKEPSKYFCVPTHLLLLLSVVVKEDLLVQWPVLLYRFINHQNADKKCLLLWGTGLLMKLLYMGISIKAIEVGVILMWIYFHWKEMINNYPEEIFTPNQWTEVRDLSG